MYAYVAHYTSQSFYVTDLNLDSIDLAWIQLNCHSDHVK